MFLESCAVAHDVLHVNVRGCARAFPALGYWQLPLAHALCGGFKKVQGPNPQAQGRATALRKGVRPIGLQDGAVTAKS